MARQASEPGASLGVADQQHGWIDALPPRARDLAMLARWDRPIGTWLLLLPCWWGLTLASDIPSPGYFLLFAIGAIAMRGAGCTINDLVDRGLDSKVARTANRPLAAGRLSTLTALLFITAQCSVGLLVLAFLPWTAVWVALASVPLIVIYPFMKRVTWWPQAFLGITFNWGVLVGAATAGVENWTLILLAYLAGFFWTLGYDTIYAHQDKEDDALIGVRSTARRLGEASRGWIIGFYAVMIALLLATGMLAAKSVLFYAALPVIVWSLARQLRAVDFDDPADCIARFRMNRLTGLCVTLALALGSLQLSG